MRFSQALKVDVKTWAKERVKLEREGGGLAKDSRSTATEGNPALEEIPKFGAGSEFGRLEREEARIKKYTPKARKTPESAPWLLKVGTGKTSKRYKGVREGGVTENASLYVFFQAHDGAFEAVPVNEWYNFNLQAKYKALTAEEAEEQFEKRDKIMNFFTVMKTKGEGNSTTLDPFDTKPKKKSRESKSFKVTDMDEWADSDADDDDSGPDLGSDDEGGRKGKKKGKKGKKESESEAGEESDEGDFDTREMDYISSSSDDDDEEDLNERLNRDLKGVVDEEGLKGLVVSDDSDEEEDKDKDNSKSDDLNDSNSKGGTNDGSAADKKNKKRINKDGEISDESVSGSDDSDLDDEEVEKSKSWVLLQAKPMHETSNNTKNGKVPPSALDSSSNSLSNTPIKEEEKDVMMETETYSPVASGSATTVVDSKLGIKRKLEATPSTSSTAKKAKTGGDEDGVSEEAIRRYLMRKPMTAKELFRKFKNKSKGKGSREKIAHQIAGILKKINPEKQTRNGELYLSLKSNAR